MNIKRPLFSMLGLVLLVLGISMVFPLLLGLFDGTQEAWSFAWIGGIGVFCGFAMFKAFQSEEEIEARDAYLLVALSWTLAGAFGAIPFLTFRAIGSFWPAFFETISGFTTTGSTVFGDVESLPRCLLLWRSMTQWLGGMGIVVLFVALLSFFGNSGLKMYRAESTGPIKEKVVPRIRQTAKILWQTYVIITLFQIIILWMLGMPLFDSVCHTFCTVATGGFSIKNNSLAFYDSPAIHWASAFFMAMCGVSFGLYYQAYKRRSLKVFWQSGEFRLYASIMFLASTVCAVILWHKGLPFQQALLDGAFQVSSIMTTTGFVTEDFDLWPVVLQLILLLIMFVGGCAGSTGGGIKVGRFLIIWKSMKTQFIKILHPRAVVVTKVDGRPIPTDIVAVTLVFFFLYMLATALGTFWLAFLGLDLVTAFSAALTAISNVGPGLSLVGPTRNFAFLPDSGLNVLSFLMVAGRLELYTVILLFTREFWAEG